jgi:hypothetical protein
MVWLPIVIFVPALAFNQGKYFCILLSQEAECKFAQPTTKASTGELKCISFISLE